MKTKEDWKELGVSSFGDLRILMAAPPPESSNEQKSNTTKGIYKRKISELEFHRFSRFVNTGFCS